MVSSLTSIRESFERAMAAHNQFTSVFVNSASKRASTLVTQEVRENEDSAAEMA